MSDYAISINVKLKQFLPRDLMDYLNRRLSEDGVRISLYDSDNKEFANFVNGDGKIMVSLDKNPTPENNDGEGGNPDSC